MRFTENPSTSPLTSLDDFSAMIEDAANYAASILSSAAPSDTGQLRRVIEKSVTQGRGELWGVGSFEDLGSMPNEAAPEGTIKAFVEDFPQFKAKKGTPYWHAPWYFLPAAGKRKLQEERAQGKYGGVAGKAPYWHVVDAGAGGRAHVKGTGYVAESAREIQYHVERRIKEFMRF